MLSGVLKDQLEKLKALEKVVDDQNAKHQESLKTIEELRADVKMLEGYRKKEAELELRESALANKERDFEKKNYEFTVKCEYAEKNNGLIAEHNKQFFDLTKIVFSSEVKTEKISRMFSEQAHYGANGSVTIQKMTESEEKKTS